MKKSIFSAIKSIVVILIIVKIFGFVKQAIVAAYFGTSSAADVFLLVSELTENLGVVIFSSIGITFLTYYVNVKNNIKTRDQLVSNVLIYGIPFSILLSVIIFIFAEPISTIIAPGFFGPEKMQVVTYIKWFTIGLVAMYVSAVCRAILDGEKHFVPSKLEGIFKSVFVILGCVLFGKTFGTEALVIALIVCYFVIAIFLYASSYKYANIRIVRPTKDSKMLQLVKLSIPLLISNGTLYIQNIVAKSIGSTLGIGAISTLSYGSYLTNAFHTLIIGSICTVLLSYFSSYVAEKDYDMLKKTLIQYLRATGIFMFVVVILIVCCSYEIVSIVYGRGKFTETSIINTAMVLTILATGLFFTSIRDILIRAHYAYQDTKATMINGIIGVGITISLCYILSNWFGIYGIAISISVASLIVAILSFITLKKHINLGCYKELFILLLQLLVIGAVTLIVNYFMKMLLADINIFVVLVIKAFVSALIFGGLLLVIKNPEMLKLIEKTKLKLARR